MISRSFHIRLRRAAVIGVACLTLAAQLGAVVHPLLVQHVTCLEHGELVDVDPSSGQARTVHAPVPEGLALTASGSDLGEQGGHGHSDCLTALHRRYQAPTAGAVDVVALLPVSDPARPALDAAHRPAEALYRVAPKCSPPV